jgi:hypothetical protein
LGSKIDWDDYERYILNAHYESSLAYLLRYAKQYWYVLVEPSKAQSFVLLSDAKRRLVMSSLSNLSKYLGIYERWRLIMRNYSLK